MNGRLFLDPDELPGTFDWSLPQPWFDMVLDELDTNPAAQVVWYYPEGSSASYPLAVTVEGARILGTIACRAQAATAVPRW